MLKDELDEFVLERIDSISGFHTCCRLSRVPQLCIFIIPTMYFHSLGNVVTQKCIFGLSKYVVTQKCIFGLSKYVVTQKYIFGLSKYVVTQKCIVGLSKYVVTQKCIVGLSKYVVTQKCIVGLTICCDSEIHSLAPRGILLYPNHVFSLFIKHVPFVG